MGKRDRERDDLARRAAEAEAAWSETLTADQRVPSGDTYVTARGHDAPEPRAEHDGSAVYIPPPAKKDDLYVPTGYVEAPDGRLVSRMDLRERPEPPDTTEDDVLVLRSLVDTLLAAHDAGGASEPRVRTAVRQAWETLTGTPWRQKWRRSLEFAIEAAAIARKNRARIDAINTKRPRYDARGWHVIDESIERWSTDRYPLDREDMMATMGLGPGVPLTGAGILAALRKRHPYEEIPSQLTPEVIETMIGDVGGGGGRGRTKTKKTPRALVDIFLAKVAELDS